MQVTVVAFGQITDITGKEQLMLQDIQDTDQLVQQLHTRFPLLAKLEYRIAVDKDIITGNRILTGPATIALLPPYAGG